MQRFFRTMMVWLPWLVVVGVGIVGLQGIGAAFLQERASGMAAGGLLLNTILRLLPLAALLLALGLTVVVIQTPQLPERAARGVQRWLYWTPRLVGIGFAALLSLFALDVFGTGAPLRETLLALLLHLVPTASLLAVLAVGWRREWIAALCFMGWSLWYLAFFGGRFPLDVYLMMAGLPFMIGVLFLLNWRRRAAP